MYLSCLLVDTGSSPDRRRPGRSWLRNMYRVHQRLCMAFPSDPRRGDDPNFLQPYDPADFPQVHARRTDSGAFLFRVDVQSGGRVVILVQSAIKPDWEYAFHNAGHFLAARPEVKPIDLSFGAKTCLRFRLVANPTRKVATIPRAKRSDVKEPGRHGRRVPVPGTDEALKEWLERRAEPGARSGKAPFAHRPRAGFRLQRIDRIQCGYVYMCKTHDRSRGQRLRSVRYDGVLEVTDADGFRNTVIRGIGPAKSFGFGLLSVAPLP